MSEKKRRLPAGTRRNASGGGKHAGSSTKRVTKSRGRAVRRAQKGRS